MLASAHDLKLAFTCVPVKYTEEFCIVCDKIMPFINCVSCIRCGCDNPLAEWYDMTVSDAEWQKYIIAHSKCTETTLNISSGMIFYNHDNLKVMPYFPELHFDVTIADPQYGIGESSKKHNSRNVPKNRKKSDFMNGTIKNPDYEQLDWDNEPPGDLYFQELIRVSAAQVIFGANYFSFIVGNPFTPPRRQNYEEFLKKFPIGWIIWDKVNGKTDFNDCELIYTSFNFKSFVVYYMWNGMMQGEEVTTDLQKALRQIGDKSKNEPRIHPTQKPVKLYKWLFKYLGLFRKKILDPNLGSFSIVNAAYDAECSLVGCEIHAGYFNKGVARSTAYINQYQLFTNG